MEKTGDDIVAAASASRAEAAMPAAAQASGPHKASAGEKLFDFLIYGPVNFFGTLILTAVIAYELEYGARGKGFFEGLSGWLKSLGLKEKTAADATRATTLMMGGNLMLIPVRAAEYYKKGIIKGLNQTLGDKSDAESVEAVPEQTWGTLIKGRLLAWFAVFGSFRTAGHFFGKEFDRFQDSVGEALAKFSKMPTHRAPTDGSKPAAALKKEIDEFKEILKPLTGKGFKPTAEQKGFIETLGAEISAREQAMKVLETKPYAFGKILALDVFATLMATSILYLGSRFFARQEQKKKAAPSPKQGATDARTESKPVAPVQKSGVPRSEIEVASIREASLVTPAAQLSV